MALRGTLKDFGIADIFQLIGHQGKNGKLSVKNRDQQVDIYFFEGNIVRAEPRNREKKDLLGSMLVRSESISQAELEGALEMQQSTHQRLGDILVENTALDRESLNVLTKLQTSETLYRLFLWDNGSYEFKNENIPRPNDRSELIRSENILMEGFRQVDEWPSIRKRISGYGMTFYKIEDLDELVAQDARTSTTNDDPFGDLDAAFSDLDGGGGSGRLKNIADNERLVYALINHDRDVQKLIDLSRLGEFEACKALCNLIDAKVIEALPEGTRKKPSANPTVGGITSVQSPWFRLTLRAVTLIALTVGGFFATRQWGLDLFVLWKPTSQGHIHTDLQQVLGRAQMRRVDDAIAVYRAEQGRLPQNLPKLVESGLLSEDEIRFPWSQPYFYRVEGDIYVLLRPLF